MPARYIGPALVALVVPVALRWFFRGSNQAGTPGKLAYAPRLRRVSLILAVASALLFGVVGVVAAPTTRVDMFAWIGLVLGFPALTLPLLIEFYRVTITFDDVGMQISSPWSRHRSLSWVDIHTVRWRKIAKWLDFSDGQNVIHVSPLLGGLPEFARVCTARIPPGVISANSDAASVIALMAEGRAGELMWANESPGTLAGRDGR